MASIIKSHNLRILAKDDTHVESNKSCNCRNKDLCPLDDECLVNNVVYKATVATTPGETKVYIGMTEHSFKTRYNNHKLSFKHRKHSHDTVLSKYIWDLKDNNTEFSIKWSIVTRASAYRGNPSRCNLCLTEKLCILQWNLDLTKSLGTGQICSLNGGFVISRFFTIHFTVTLAGT